MVLDFVFSRRFNSGFSIWVLLSLWVVVMGIDFGSIGLCLGFGVVLRCEVCCNALCPYMSCGMIDRAMVLEGLGYVGLRFSCQAVSVGVSGCYGVCSVVRRLG